MGSFIVNSISVFITGCAIDVFAAVMCLLLISKLLKFVYIARDQGQHHHQVVNDLHIRSLAQDRLQGLGHVHAPSLARRATPLLDFSK